MTWITSSPALTNSLTGAGVSKYILPGIGIVLGLTAVFGALGWILRRRRHHPHHFGYSLLALLLALGSVDASPAFRQITELVKSQGMFRPGSFPPGLPHLRIRPALDRIHIPQFPMHHFIRFFQYYIIMFG